LKIIYAMTLLEVGLALTRGIASSSMSSRQLVLYIGKSTVQQLMRFTAAVPVRQLQLLLLRRLQKDEVASVAADLGLSLEEVIAQTLEVMLSQQGDSSSSSSSRGGGGCV
jgi:hypothetical protein